MLNALRRRTLAIQSVAVVSFQHQANIVYENHPVTSVKDARKIQTDETHYKKRLLEEGGEGMEMWFYKCEAEGTEAAVTYSPVHKRCTVIFRGTGE